MVTQKPNILLVTIFNTCVFFVLDFEYCSYNYRAFDIANHFCEWTYNYTHKEHPYFTVIRENAPTKEQKLKFIRAYLDEQGSKEDPEKLLEEVEVFTLGCHLLWSMWGVVNADFSQITFGHWVSIKIFVYYFLFNIQQSFAYQKRAHFENVIRFLVSKINIVGNFFKQTTTRPKINCLPTYLLKKNKILFLNTKLAFK